MARNNQMKMSTKLTIVLRQSTKKLHQLLQTVLWIEQLKFIYLTLRENVCVRVFWCFRFTYNIAKSLGSKTRFLRN